MILRGIKNIMQNNNVFTCLGASNHSVGKREKHDYYATDPKIEK